MLLAQSFRKDYLAALGTILFLVAIIFFTTPFASADITVPSTPNPNGGQTLQGGTPNPNGGTTFNGVSSAPNTNDPRSGGRYGEGSYTSVGVYRQNGTITKPKSCITATPRRIAKGETVKIAWAAPTSNHVKIDHGIGKRKASGSVERTPKHTTTYTLRYIGAPTGFRIGGGGSYEAVAVSQQTCKVTVVVGKGEELSDCAADDASCSDASSADKVQEIQDRINALIEKIRALKAQQKN